MSFVSTVPFVIFRITCVAAETFSLYDNLNPIKTPCLDSTDGNCQDAVTLVEELGVKLKFLGGWDGAVIQNLTHQSRSFYKYEIFSGI